MPKKKTPPLSIVEVPNPFAWENAMFGHRIPCKMGRKFLQQALTGKFVADPPLPDTVFGIDVGLPGRRK